MSRHDTEQAADDVADAFSAMRVVSMHLVEIAINDPRYYSSPD